MRHGLIDRFNIISGDEKAIIRFLVNEPADDYDLDSINDRFELAQLYDSLSYGLPFNIQKNIFQSDVVKNTKLMALATEAYEMMQSDAAGVEWIDAVNNRDDVGSLISLYGRIQNLIEQRLNTGFSCFVKEHTVSLEEADEVFGSEVLSFQPDNSREQKDRKLMIIRSVLLTLLEEKIFYSLTFTDLESYKETVFVRMDGGEFYLYEASEEEPRSFLKGNRA